MEDQTTSAGTSSSEPTRPTEPRTVEYVVLVHWREGGEKEEDERIAVAGTVTAANRAAAEELLLEQAPGVPNLLLGPGETVEVRLVAASAWGLTFPVTAAQKVVLERVV